MADENDNQAASEKPEAPESSPRDLMAALRASVDDARARREARARDAAAGSSS